MEASDKVGSQCELKVLELGLRYRQSPVASPMCLGLSLASPEGTIQSRNLGSLHQTTVELTHFQDLTVKQESWRKSKCRTGPRKPT